MIPRPPHAPKVAMHADPPPAPLSALPGVLTRARAAAVIALLALPGTAAAQANDADPPQAAPEAAAIDPVTEAAARVLEQSGIIARQAEISESLILIDRQIRQAELIRTLLATLGPDAPVEIAPGVFRTFNDTPEALRQRIELVQLESQLADLRERLEGSPDRIRREIDRIRLERELADAAQEGRAPSSESLRREIERIGLERELALLRDDDPESPAALRRRIEVARLRQELAAIEAGIRSAQAEVPPLARGGADATGPGLAAVSLSPVPLAPGAAAGAAAARAEPAPPEVAPPPLPQIQISLREIAGRGSFYWAVILFGVEEVRIEAGDTLSDGTRVVEIGRAFVRLDRNGAEELLELRI